MRQEMTGIWDAVALAGPYANNLHLAAGKQSSPRSRQIATPTPYHSIFLQAGCFQGAQPIVSKHRWTSLVSSGSSGKF